MKDKISKIIIAKDGFPLEQIEGHPIINFLRRLLHSSHRECEERYRHKEKAIENPSILQDK